MIRWLCIEHRLAGVFTKEAPCCDRHFVVRARGDVSLWYRLRIAAKSGARVLAIRAISTDRAYMLGILQRHLGARWSRYYESCHAGAPHGPAAPRGVRGWLCENCNESVDRILTRRRAA